MDVVLICVAVMVLAWRVNRMEKKQCTDSQSPSSLPRSRSWRRGAPRSSRRARPASGKGPGRDRGEDPRQGVGGVAEAERRPAGHGLLQEPPRLVRAEGRRRRRRAGRRAAEGHAEGGTVSAAPICRVCAEPVDPASEPTDGAGRIHLRCPRWSAGARVTSRVALAVQKQAPRAVRRLPDLCPLGCAGQCDHELRQAKRGWPA